MAIPKTFANDAEAIGYARKLASDLAKRGAKLDSVLMIIGEDGKVVAEVPVRKLDS